MDKPLSLFENLYDKYADGIFRYLFFKLGDRERAKELTQDVFLKAWQSLVSGTDIKYEKAFLYKIAHNLFINEIRTNRSKYSLEEMTDTGYEPVDPKTNSENEANHNELLAKLNQINESYRTVLIMRYIEDLPVKDIAVILEEKETNISMRIKRGLESLKKIYETST